jgi:hypothetical protein
VSRIHNANFYVDSERVTDVLCFSLARCYRSPVRVMTARVLFGAPGIGDTAVAPYASSAAAGAGAGVDAGRRYHNPRLAESGCIRSSWRVCFIEEWPYLLKV